MITNPEVVEAVERAIEKARLYSRSPTVWAKDAIDAYQTATKPRWEDAPEWAQYKATNHSGQVWWFSERPIIEAHLRCWLILDPGRSQFAQYVGVPDDWQSTLEPRPEEGNGH